MRPVFEARDHLLIYPLQYEGIECSPNIVYTGAAPNQQIIPAVRWACQSLGKRRFYVMGSDYVFPRTALAIIEDELRQLGAELVGEEFLPLGNTDFAGAAQRVLESGADVMLNLVNGDSNIALYRTLRAGGVSGISRMWQLEHDRFVLAQLLAIVEKKFQQQSITVFRAVVLQQRPAREVAEELGMTLGAVRVAQSRVLRALRQLGEGLIDSGRRQF